MNVGLLAEIALPCVVLWWAIGEKRLVSLDTVLSLACFTFVLLGLALEPELEESLAARAGIGFYACLLLGLYVARRTMAPSKYSRRAIARLVLRGEFRSSLVFAFVALSILPWITVLAAKSSIVAQYQASWQSNTVASTSAAVVEASETKTEGVPALLTALQNQASGVWYLAAGAVFLWRPKLFWPLYLMHIVGAFLTASGSRSNLMLLAIMPVLMMSFTASPRDRRRLVWGVALLGLLSLLTLDWLRHGRGELVAEGTIAERIERTLRIDIAYGGLGVRVGEEHKAQSREPGLRYLARLLTLPVPRVIYPEKSIWNPNQEFTEAATGKPLSETGSIMLFTPLGEGLFVFGWPGIALIPFAYGLLAGTLEKLYGASEVLLGLKAQVYAWGILSMRLTFYNLYLVLVIGNALLLLAIAVITLRERTANAMPRDRGSPGTRKPDRTIRRETSTEISAL